MKMARRAPAWGAALLGLTLAAAAPAAAQSDEVPLDHERLTEFARAHLAMNDARDEFHGQVGRIHDEQGRERARQELEQRIDEILTEHSMTREQYDEITLIISLDGEARAAFDEIVQQLEEEGGGPTG